MTSQRLAQLFYCTVIKDPWLELLRALRFEHGASLGLPLSTHLASCWPAVAPGALRDFTGEGIAPRDSPRAAAPLEFLPRLFEQLRRALGSGGAQIGLGQ